MIFDIDHTSDESSEDSPTLSDDEFTSTNEIDSRSLKELRELQHYTLAELEHLKGLEQKQSNLMFIKMHEKALTRINHAIKEKKGLKAGGKDVATSRVRSKVATKAVTKLGEPKKTTTKTVTKTGDRKKSTSKIVTKH